MSSYHRILHGVLSKREASTCWSRCQYFGDGASVSQCLLRLHQRHRSGVDQEVNEQTIRGQWAEAAQREQQAKLLSSRNGKRCWHRHAVNNKHSVAIDHLRFNLLIPYSLIISFNVLCCNLSHVSFDQFFECHIESFRLILKDQAVFG